MDPLEAKNSSEPSASEKAQMGDSDSESTLSDPLDLTQDEGWEDVEPDMESVTVVSLFDNETFTDVLSMLKHCKHSYGFDFVKTRADLDLDFLETVKLVNYIRSEVKSGNRNPSILKRNFDDERYLRPVLEDDTLLYSFDDVEVDTKNMATENGLGDLETDPRSMAAKLKDLEESLMRVQLQFSEYKNEVQKTILPQMSDECHDTPRSSLESHARENRSNGSSTHLDHQHASTLVDLDGVRQKSEGLDTTHSLSQTSGAGEMSPGGDNSGDGYFSSYSFNEIHELMLKDAIRTDAYRDFIYDNKQLFKDKIVLDVGCGTGILSMFCAKAGAKMVIAVDNSKIIDKAREIVFENGLGDVVKCLRGKIEEVTLPVPKVDIVVSEWMGYGLLYEAMLDSVIWARDHYLSNSGLMIPSHATLRLAPVCDPEFVESHVTFWHSVYGFNMSSMLERAYEQALIRVIDANACVADAPPFLQLDLYTASVADLTFLNEFSVVLTQDVDSLDAWALWFDIFFVPTRTSDVQIELSPAKMIKSGLVAFTTSPQGPKTHWEQSVLLLDQRKKTPAKFKNGTTIKGQIGYKKSTPQSRSLEINMTWETEDGGYKDQQTWFMD